LAITVICNIQLVMQSTPILCLVRPLFKGITRNFALTQGSEMWTQGPQSLCETSRLRF